MGFQKFEHLPWITCMPAFERNQRKVWQGLHEFGEFWIPGAQALQEVEGAQEMMGGLWRNTIFERQTLNLQQLTATARM